MSRRNRQRRPPQQLNKAVAIRPAATFTVDQIQALASAGLVGPSIPASQSLPRDPGWATVPFAPGTPLFPQQINQPRDGARQAEPRQWEYPVSWNLPGFSDRLIPWAILRNAADIPLFRQCIETRKAEAVTRPWDIRLSDNAVRRAAAKAPNESESDIRDALEKKVQPAIGRLIDFWQEPDRINGHDFHAWVTMLLEEVLVLDALAIYPRRTMGGGLYSLEIIDGTTVKPLLDDFGRRPQPPYPAYQQVLYGFPRGEFIASIDLDPEVAGQQPPPGSYQADQLIYHVQHTRTFTPYGHSAVERALQDGDLWMRRHGWLKAEYTDGVMPSGWLEAGEGQAEWTPQQLEVFEKAFNDYYAGATPSRQRFRILPWGMKPSKNEDLGEKYKPDYDLFLLKLVVRHFDTTVTELGFSETRGLGSAGFHQGQQELQERTAEKPTLDRLASLLTRLQQRFLGAPPELEFVFPEDDEKDKKAEDDEWAGKVATGRATRNEDRDRQGMARFTFPEADMPSITTASGLLFIEGSSHAAAPGQVLGPGQPPGMGLPGAPPPGAPSEGEPGAPPPTGGPAGGPGPAPAGGPAPAPPASALTKADLAWLDSQMALTRPGATGLEAAQATLVKADAERELGQYRKWNRNGRRGQFQFTHLTRAQGLDSGVNPSRVTFKADAPDEAPQPAQQWPGWDHDMAAAAAGGTALLAALGGTGLVAAIVTRLRDRMGDESGGGRAVTSTPPDAAEVSHILDELGVGQKIQTAITPVIEGLHSTGAAIGATSAQHLLDGTPMPATPQDWSAAARLLTADEGGTGPGLRQMLAERNITIKAIADTQVEQLARVLADGLGRMKTPAQIANTVQNLGVGKDRAQMIAHTELARAMGQAAMDRYQEMAVPGAEWLRAPDERVCPICAKNADAGPVPLGEAYPSGHLFPPAHPRCRCVPVPVLVKADAPMPPPGGGTFDAAKHPRAAGGKFGTTGGQPDAGGGGAAPADAAGGQPGGAAPTGPVVSVADIHAAANSTTVGGDTTAGDHPAAKLTAGAQAKQNAAQQMAARNDLLRQRIGLAQKAQADAAARRQAAAAAQAKAKAAAAAKKAAKAKAKAKGGGGGQTAAQNRAQSILNHLDALAAGKTDGELLDALGLQYPDLALSEIAELIKAWDPAFHPRDPLTGRFVSVGVRRPAFKPKTRKRWGRSKSEIQAWEQARAHGEHTQYPLIRRPRQVRGRLETQLPRDVKGVGEAPARGVGRAKVGQFHQALDPLNFRQVGLRHVQENMLVGRNRKELVVLANALGMDGEALPRDLHNAKQRILDHEHEPHPRSPHGTGVTHDEEGYAFLRDGTDLNGYGESNHPVRVPDRKVLDAERDRMRAAIKAGAHDPAERDRMLAALDAAHADLAAGRQPEPVRLPTERKLGDMLPRAAGDAGVDKHHGYNTIQDLAVDAARVNHEPDRALDRFGQLRDQDIEGMAPAHQLLIQNKLGELQRHDDQRIRARAGRIGERFGVLPPASPPPARVPKTDPVAHVYGELDKVAGDAEAMDRLIAPLDLRQHRQLAVMVGHNAGGALDNPQDIRDEIIRQRLVEHHADRLIRQGMGPENARIFAGGKARHKLRELRAVPREPVVPAGAVRIPEPAVGGLPAAAPVVGKVRPARFGGPEFETEHGRLDDARGNRAAMDNAIAHLQKKDLIELARQRGHRIDGMGAKKADLQRQFMFEEAYKRHREQAIAAGMDGGAAANHALQEARKVRDGIKLEQQMAADLKVQKQARAAADAAARARRANELAEAQAKEAFGRVKRAPLAAQVHLNTPEVHGTGVTHDEEGYAIHPNPNEMGGVFGGVVPHEAVPVRHHIGIGDAADRIRAGQAELAANIASGVKSKRSPDVQGAIGETAIVTHNNGAKSVHKKMNDNWYDGKAQAHSEELGAHLALHMGIHAPVTRQDPDNPRAVHMEFMDGYAAASKLRLSNIQEEQIRNSPVGRKVALLDVLVGNQDRHSGNWMLPADKGNIDFNNPDVVVIDHGFSFPISDHNIKNRGYKPTDDTVLSQGLSGNTGRGVFSANLGHRGSFTSNNYSAEEIDNARTALERMKPEFDRTGRMDWYNLAVARLGKVARMSNNQSARALAIGGVIHA